jgi:glycosyltransferase involved in cell wall biosynthesis
MAVRMISAAPDECQPRCEKSLLNDICVIIPAFDEEETIGKVVRGCLKYSNEVIVVDGHSRDRTCEVAIAAGAKIYSQRGQGKGCAMRDAAEVTKRPILVFIDGDGSHDPEDIPALAQPVIEGRADVVIGSRILGGSAEWYGSLGNWARLIGSAIITACLSIRFGVGISDSQNGFRAIRRSLFLSLGLKSKHTTIEQEMLARCLSRGATIMEIASFESARVSGNSHISIVRDWPRYIYSLICGICLPSPRRNRPEETGVETGVTGVPSRESNR